MYYHPLPNFFLSNKTSPCGAHSFVDLSPSFPSPSIRPSQQQQLWWMTCPYRLVVLYANRLLPTFAKATTEVPSRGNNSAQAHTDRPEVPVHSKQFSHSPFVAWGNVCLLSHRTKAYHPPSFELWPYLLDGKLFPINSTSQCLKN
jgi:hypothetical protein